jgi:bifunctional DNase/RNase
VRVSGLVLAMLVGVAAGARARSVEVEVGGMGLDSVTGSPVLRLVEKGRARTGRQLPIWIGPFEAQAIALEMRGLPSPRPLTHDLMKQLVERLGGKLERVVIEDLRDGTYFATVHVAGPEGKHVAVDARPSDAIALALRLHGPILVAEELFGRVAAARPAPAARRLWGLTVQNLTPEVAAFFRVSAHQGVLVSDVATGAPAGELARGDVITALDDRPVRSIAELVSRADARGADEPVRLSVQRDGRDLTVTFAGQ